MHVEPRQSRLLAAFFYAMAAVASAVSLWLVLSIAFSFDAENRDRLLIGMRPMLIVWVFVCCSGIVFAVLALRFATLNVLLHRTMLAASCVVAVVAGLWLEWWQSLYFVLPALLLGLAFRGAVHA
jgi:hypothetical protein